MTTTGTFKRLFIANRGEVAARVGRTCESLGIEPVFGVSEADREAPYTRGHESVVLGPPRASESYLDPMRVVQAAVQSRCSALHPGWGFLSENAEFAALCEAHGVRFIGPPAHVIQLMGSKTPAKRAMAEAGLQVIPGSDGVLHDLADARACADVAGYPVLLKAESGGGGRGMRIAREPRELAGAWDQAAAEAQAAFGDPRLYLEKWIGGGRHVELQLLADGHGEVVHLGERDCTVQRRHQKLIEESPAPALEPAEAARAREAAVRAARELGYVGAGTMEFLQDEDGSLRFMEMNTRLQVEHCVTEMRANRDLVADQIRIAAGHRLGLRQEDVTLEGCAIECRINAEDPSKDFRPKPGTLTRWQSPDTSGGNVRVDTHVETGYTVPPFYDSLLCKVIARAPDRDTACDRLMSALSELVCEGLPTTIPMHLAILGCDAFRGLDYDASRIPGWPPER